MTMLAIARASLGLLPRLGWPMLAALLAVTIGTNLLDFATVSSTGLRPDEAFALTAAVRVILVFWIGFVVQRRLVDPAARFGIGPSSWRFVALQVLLLLGMVVVRAAVLQLMPPAPNLAGEWLANFIGVAAWALISIRSLAWNAALAAGAQFADLAPLWRGLRGHDSALINAFVLLVLPLAALHLAFTLIGIRVAMAPGPLAFLSVFDGLVSALQLALNCAIAAIALRLATERQAR